MGDFQNVFKKLRLSLGYTQSELAEALGISRSRIGMYETGAREPDFETLEIIADFFNVDTDYLLGRTNKTTYIPNEKYYLNEETAKAAQEIFENKELRMLFDVTRNADAEDLRALHNMALALKRKERGNIDDTGC